MLSGGPFGALERKRERQAETARAAACEELGLVEAALPPPLGVNRHRHEQLAADRGASPTPGHQIGEWLDKAQLAVVLQCVQCGPRRAGECRAPFELDDSSWLIGRQPDRRRGRLFESPLHDATTRRAQRNPFATAAGARRRQQQVEQGLHGHSVKGADHHPLARHLSSA